MKKLIVFAFCIAFVLCQACCSVKEATVWDWAQGLKQEDIVSASPWGEGNNFNALSQEETAELVILINNLTKTCFTENSDLRGGTPTFGIQIDTATKTFYINESIAPNGGLEIEYDETMWWIDNTELHDFIQKVTEGGNHELIYFQWKEWDESVDGGEKTIFFHIAKNNMIIQTTLYQSRNHIVNIVDRTKTEGFPYDMAEEKFFEDGDNEYYFSGIYSYHVIVHYEDGSQEDIVTALNAGRATVADLDKFEVDYIVKVLGTENVKPSDETISQTEAEKIALTERKVNYDYIKAEFDTDKNAWEIEFWEDNATIAAQTIQIDTTGKVLSIGYAE